MKLLIFTQKVDKNDTDLGFFHSWLLEFAKKCESIKVICLYKGESSLPDNVEVFSLGKESNLGRLSYLINLYKYLYRLEGQYDKVFVHMNPVYIVLCGFYFKLQRIPVYLWYVHRSVDLKLKIAILFVEKIFTSTKESFRVQTGKVVFLGHGIDVSKLSNTEHLFKEGVLRIAHVGRITPIKNIETLILAGEELKKRNLDIQIDFFGDCVTDEDKEYKLTLERLIEEKELKNEVNFAGGFVYRDLPIKLQNSHITVNMTPPGGMDKVVLESILLGIPAFVSNTAFRDLFGQYSDLFLYSFGDSSDLANKIYNFINTPDAQNIINIMYSKVRKDFSLDSLIDKIISIMK